MKYAPLLAGGILATVLLTLATAKDVVPSTRVVKIDVEGIDTLRAQSPGLIVNVKNTSASYSYADSKNSAVRVTREGRTLVIDAKLEKSNLTVTVPPGVHRFEVDSGTFTSSVAMEDVEVVAPNYVSWEGDARRLAVRDLTKPLRPGEHPCGCGEGSISVRAGKIGELQVHSLRGNLQLYQPDDIGTVYAWLGPKGTVTLSGARRFDHVHVMDFGDEMPPATGSAKTP